jgi:hypothetical protein
MFDVVEWYHLVVVYGRYRAGLYDCTVVTAVACTYCSEVSGASVGYKGEL